MWAVAAASGGGREAYGRLAIGDGLLTILNSGSRYPVKTRLMRQKLTRMNNWRLRGIKCPTGILGTCACTLMMKGTIRNRHLLILIRNTTPSGSDDVTNNARALLRPVGGIRRSGTSRGRWAAAGIQCNSVLWEYVDQVDQEELESME